MRQVIQRANLPVKLFDIGSPLTSTMQMEAWHFSETSLFTCSCTECHDPWTQYALLYTTWMHANVGKMLQHDTPQLYSVGIYIQYYHVCAAFAEGAHSISVLKQNTGTWVLNKLWLFYLRSYGVILDKCTIRDTVLHNCHSWCTFQSNQYSRTPLIRINWDGQLIRICRKSE